MLGALAVAAVLVALNRAHVGRVVAYLLAGGALRFAFHHGGVHATISGVGVGLAVPARPRAATPDQPPPLRRFIHGFHPWVAFLIMPLFALANSGVRFAEMTAGDLGGPVSRGIAAGPLLGKPLGIMAFTALAVRLGVAGSLHRRPGLPQESRLLEQAKLGILLGSLLAGGSGYLISRLLQPPQAAAGAVR